MRSVSRGRRSIAAATLVALSLFAAACGSDSEGGKAGDSSKPAEGGAASGETLELGLVGPFSGNFADIGESLKRGAEIAVQQINEAGGNVKLTTSDDQGDTKLTTQAVSDLASKGVNLTFGYALSPGCLAAAQMAVQTESLVMSAACAGVNLVEQDLQPTFFRVGPTDEMFMYATAAMTAEQFPDVTTWSVIGPDYNVGHEMWEYFREHMATRGIEVKARNEVFHPLDATDLTPYITSVMRGASAEEGLLITDTSGLILNLLKQAKPYGLVDAFGAVVNGGGFLPQAYALGSDMPEIWNVYRWADGAIDTELAKQFEADHAELFPKDRIDSVALNAYTAVYAYYEASQKAGSVKAADISEALVGLSFEGVLGTVTIGENHQASGPMLGRHFVPNKDSEDGFDITETVILPSDPSMD